MPRLMPVRLAVGLAISASILTFSFGVGVGVFHWFPYTLLHSVYNTVWKRPPLIDLGARSSTTIELPGLSECNLQLVHEIPKESTAVIGHAYGAPGQDQNEGFISPKIELFLDSYKSYFEIVIFTGDVFREPTSQKWARLHEKYQKQFQIYVAPGNHDIGTPSARQIFLASPFNLPAKSISVPNHNFIIEDSVSSNWLLSQRTLSQINSSKDEALFLFRHNLPTIEMLPIANSNDLASAQLPSAQELGNLIKSSKKLTIISGDTGAFERLPRVTCHTYRNITFISSGIGDLPNDTVLLLKDNEVFHFPL